MYIVSFLNDRGQLVEKKFDSPYLARVFANKIRHSKRCRLVSEPLYD